MKNLSSIKKHYDAFWEGSYIDRCCMSIKSHVENIPFEPETLEQKWEDIPFRCKREQYIIENTKYYADAFADVFIDFGPGSLAEFIGGTYKWAEDTVWYDQKQIIEDYETLPEFNLNKNSVVFKLAESFTRKMLEYDKAVPSVLDIGGIMDTLAALRGSQNLLFDLYDYPEEVMKVRKSIQDLWYDTYMFFSELILKEKGVMTTWVPVLSDKPFYPIQCDFSAMISPDMFETFVLPELEFQTTKMPRSIYHLDGVGEIPHLDHLLNLKGLSAIQWSPGAGQADITDEQWFDMYRRIQKAGKGLILMGVDPVKAENLLKKISPNGLFITSVCKDEAQAKELIECATKR